MGLTNAERQARYRERHDITGRDGFIIAKALVIAVDTLKREKHPPHSDIADMEEVLNKRFAQLAKVENMMLQLKRLVRLGIVTSDNFDAIFPDGASAENIDRLIAEHEARLDKAGVGRIRTTKRPKD
jgi:hypothetical protein